MDRQQRISAIAEAINVFPGTARAMESGPALLEALRDIRDGMYVRLDTARELARAALARVEGAAL